MCLVRVEVRVSVMVRDMVMVGFRVRVRVQNTGYGCRTQDVGAEHRKRTRRHGMVSKMQHDPDPKSDPNPKPITAYNSL